MSNIIEKFEKKFPDDVYVIAEMSANHGGKYEKAEAIVRAAKKAGADCVKVQVYTADSITIDGKQNYFMIHDGEWKGQSLYDLYKQAYMPWEWLKPLKDLCDQLKIDFLATPFDEKAVDVLEEMGIDFYKVASAEVNHTPLLKYIAKMGKPILLSDGMSSLSDLELAINTIRAEGNDMISILKCSSVYPANYEELNLMTIKHLSETFDVVPGFSDHALGSTSAIVAVALGAKIVEKHICLDGENETVDAFFSLDASEFEKMVKEIRLASKAIGRVTYAKSNSEKNSQKYKRSLLISQSIKKGERLTHENVKVARPGVGLEPKYLDDFIGKKVTVDKTVGDILDWKDIE